MPDKPEFSFFVNCDHLKEADKTYEIEANVDERAALADRLNLLELYKLQAKALVSRISSQQVHLDCSLSADIVQACVVTSKPLESHIDCTFDRVFDASAKAYYGSETEPEEESYSGEDLVPDPPEPMIDGGFDLGESVVEQLLLEMEPFPRSTDAEFEGYSSTRDDDGDGTVNPFAVLEQLKKK